MARRIASTSGSTAPVVHAEKSKRLLLGMASAAAISPNVGRDSAADDELKNIDPIAIGFLRHCTGALFNLIGTLPFFQ